MSGTPQNRALKSYRERLQQRGIARFEVLGLETDRELIRSLARKLADNGPDAPRIRATVRRSISRDSATTGGILNALRQSPLVSSGLNLNRSSDSGRDVDL